VRGSTPLRANFRTSPALSLASARDTSDKEPKPISGRFPSHLNLSSQDLPPVEVTFRKRPLPSAWSLGSLVFLQKAAVSKFDLAIWVSSHPLSHPLVLDSMGWYGSYGKVNVLLNKWLDNLKRVYGVL